MPESSSIHGNRPFATLRSEAAADDQTFPITASISRIGQGPQNEIVLDDDTVSTQHARLEFSDGAWRLTDLESRNGTYLEGVRLAPGVPTPLSNNSVVAFGTVTLAFRTREDAIPDGPPEPRVQGSQAEVRRAGFRLPVWLLAIVVILIFLIVFLFFWFGGDAPTAATLLDSIESFIALPPIPAAA